jgi:acylphosphatase
MPCLRLLISGRVQGVWFRESMRQEALNLGATGWVRNLPDGRVEAVICGEADILESLLKWAGNGPTNALVTGMEREQIPEQPFAGFEKRP